MHTPGRMHVFVLRRIPVVRNPGSLPEGEFPDQLQKELFQDNADQDNHAGPGKKVCSFQIDFRVVQGGADAVCGTGQDLRRDACLPGQTHAGSGCGQKEGHDGGKIDFSQNGSSAQAEDLGHFQKVLIAVFYPFIDICPNQGHYHQKRGKGRNMVAGKKYKQQNDKGCHRGRPDDFGDGGEKCVQQSGQGSQDTDERTDCQRCQITDNDAQDRQGNIAPEPAGSGKSPEFYQHTQRGGNQQFPPDQQTDDLPDCKPYHRNDNGFYQFLSRMVLHFR